jgi:hypothetical protein
VALDRRVGDVERSAVWERFDVAAEIGEQG